MRDLNIIELNYIGGTGFLTGLGVLLILLTVADIFLDVRKILNHSLDCNASNQAEQLLKRYQEIYGDLPSSPA